MQSLRAKMQGSATDEEWARALCQFACLWKEADGDDRVLILFLKEVYLNPRFNAVKHLPGILDVLVIRLTADRKTRLPKPTVARYDADRARKVPDALSNAI
jgi:hypothetical protein